MIISGGKKSISCTVQARFLRQESRIAKSAKCKRLCRTQLQEFQQLAGTRYRYIASKRYRMCEIHVPSKIYVTLRYNTVKKIYIPRLIEYSLEARVAREKKKKKKSTPAWRGPPHVFGECLTSSIRKKNSACTCFYLVPFALLRSLFVDRSVAVTEVRTERTRKMQENVT